MSDWQFELDEVGPDAEPDEQRVEPGSPSLENVAFFVLGIALAIFLVVSML